MSGSPEPSNPEDLRSSQNPNPEICSEPRKEFAKVPFGFRSLRGLAPGFNALLLACVRSTAWSGGSMILLLGEVGPGIVCWDHVWTLDSKDLTTYLDLGPASKTLTFVASARAVEKALHLLHGFLLQRAAIKSSARPQMGS